MIVVLPLILLIVGVLTANTFCLCYKKSMQAKAPEHWYTLNPHTTTHISRTVNTPAEPMSYTYHHINPRKRFHANFPLSSPNKIQPPKNELKEDHEQAKKTCPLQRGYVQRRIFSRRGSSQGCQKKIR